jgi:hypothetical protein
MHHNGNLIVKRVIFGYHYSSFPNKYRSLVEEVFDFFLCTQTPYIQKTKYSGLQNWTQMEKHEYLKPATDKAKVGEI